MTTKAIEKGYLQQLAEGNEFANITLQAVKSGRLYMDGWQDWNYQLTDKDIEQIVNVLGGWEKTRNTIANKLRYLKELPSFWALDRIVYCKHSNRWSYIAGQDYPAELATIRKWFNNL